MAHYKKGIVTEAPFGEKYSIINIEGVDVFYPRSCAIGEQIEVETYYEHGKLHAKSMFASKDLIEKYFDEARFVKIISRYNKEFLICKSNTHFIQVSLPDWIKKILLRNNNIAIPLIFIRNKTKINYRKFADTFFQEGETYNFTINELKGDFLIGSYDGLEIELPKTQGFSYKNIGEEIAYIFNSVNKDGKLLFNPTTRIFITPERILGNNAIELLNDSNYRVKGCEEVWKQIKSKDNRWIITFFKFIQDVIVNSFERKDSKAFRLITILHEENKYERVKTSFLAGFAKSSAININYPIQLTLQLVEATSILEKNKIDVINFEPYNNSLEEEQEERIIRTILEYIGPDYFSIAQINRLLERSYKAECISRNVEIHKLCTQKIQFLTRSISWSINFDFEGKVEQRSSFLNKPEVANFINGVIKYFGLILAKSYQPVVANLFLNTLRFSFLVSRKTRYQAKDYSFPFINELIDNESQTIILSLSDDLKDLQRIYLNKSKTAILENNSVEIVYAPYYFADNVFQKEIEVISKVGDLEVHKITNLSYSPEENDGIVKGIIHNYYEHSLYSSDYYAFTYHDRTNRKGDRIWIPKFIEGFSTNIPKGYFQNGDTVSLKKEYYEGTSVLKLDYNSKIYNAFTNFNPQDGEYKVVGIDEPNHKERTDCPICSSQLRKGRDKTIYCSSRECEFLFYPSLYLENSLGIFRVLLVQFEKSYKFKLQTIININSAGKQRTIKEVEFCLYEINAEIKYCKANNSWYDNVSQMLSECFIDDVIVMESKSPREELQNIYRALKSPKSYICSMYNDIELLFSKIGTETNQFLSNETNNLADMASKSVSYFEDIEGIVESIESIKQLFEGEQSVLELDLSNTDKPFWRTKGLVANYLIAKKIYDKSYSNQILEDIKISLLSFFMSQELNLDKNNIEISTVTIEKGLIETIITERLPESENLEFKETFVRPVHTYEQRNKIQILESRLKGDIKDAARKGIIEAIKNESKLPPNDKAKQKVVIHSTLKNVCAMLNKTGGKIIIGIRDNKDKAPEAVGLQQDYEIFGGFDDLELYFHQMIRSYLIDFEFWSTFISTKKEVYEDKDFFVIEVSRVSHQEKRVCFLKSITDSSKEEKAYIKSGSSSVTLAPSKVQSFTRPKISTADQPCYVYVIKNGRGNVKIGISLNPWKRKQTLSPENIDLEEPICFRFKNRVIAKDIEQTLHEKYSLYRIGNSEWFDFHIEQYDSTIKDLRNMLNSEELSLP